MSDSFNAPANNQDRQGGGEHNAGVSSALIAASLGSKVAYGRPPFKVVYACSLSR